MQADAHALTKLAADRGRRQDLVVAMNEKLNRVIDAEAAEDRGEMLPGGTDAGREATPETMAGA